MILRTVSGFVFAGLMVSGPTSVVQQPNRPGERVRVIPFDSRTPIESRLLPQDDVVVIEKDRFPPGIAVNSGETLEEALDRAAAHDTIVLAHGLVMGGTLIDEGTWIRGAVTAPVSDVIKAWAWIGPEITSADFLAPRRRTLHQERARQGRNVSIV